MNNNYYYTNSAGEVVGPVSRDELKKLIDDKLLNLDTQICREGSEDWQSLSRFLWDTDPAAVQPSATSEQPQASASLTAPRRVERTARSPSLNYANVILTIIAACLVFQVVRALTPKPIAVEVQNPPDKIPTTLSVRIVGISQPLDVNLATIGNDSLSRVGGQVVLPVGVHNTVDVDIKGLNGHTMRSSIMSAGSGSEGLPVCILNQ